MARFVRRAAARELRSRVSVAAELLVLKACKRTMLAVLTFSCTCIYIVCIDACIHEFARVLGSPATGCTTPAPNPVSMFMRFQHAAGRPACTVPQGWRPTNTAE